MQVRIYQPARNAMQSGNGNTRQWVLQFVSPVKREADPLMGWTTSDNMRTQVLLKFDTKEEAIAYAQREGYAYTVEEPAPRRLQVKAYADNFRYDRVGRWTH
ncbi:ETC complex I subunit [Dongia deserti]|uniref:ETC complex I subunit n=1 Tax=Dongia deserti TaxID=2268030 RepID=UPI000E647A7A|nr:ETC complex I subunit [Dongia deserti]